RAALRVDTLRADRAYLVGKLGRPGLVLVIEVHDTPAARALRRLSVRSSGRGHDVLDARGQPPLLVHDEVLERPRALTVLLVVDLDVDPRDLYPKGLHRCRRTASASDKRRGGLAAGRRTVGGRGDLAQRHALGVGRLALAHPVLSGID